MSYILERRVKTLEELVSGLSAPELDFLDGVTAGTATESKAVVLGASKNMPLDVVYNTTVRQSADVVKDDGAAASALTGLVHTVVPGTYKYRAMIQCLSTANGGVKITMDLTTAVLTSIQNVGRGSTASAQGASARTTTATDNATLYAATAAITQIELEGTMVVSTGGTIQLNAEQNASHADESTFYTGSTFEMIRIA